MQESYRIEFTNLTERIDSINKFNPDDVYKRIQEENDKIREEVRITTTKMYTDMNKFVKEFFQEWLDIEAIK